MALRRQDKEVIVAELNDVAQRAVSALGANYRGVGVADLTELRAQARKAGVYMRVVRNTLARRAVEGTDFSCMQDSLTGPTILAFSLDEPSAAARVMRDFCKTNDIMQVTVLALSGKAMGGEALEAVAKLPTKEEALSRLLAVMKAPTEKFVRTLAAVPTKTVRVLVAIREQKESQ